MPRCYPPIGRPIGTPPRDTHITWPWRLRPAVSYQSSGAASAPGGNTPRALYGAGADGHPEAPDRRPLGACPYRRQCAECSPSKFIGGPLQTVMGCGDWLLASVCTSGPPRFCNGPYRMAERLRPSSPPYPCHRHSRVDHRRPARSSIWPSYLRSDGAADKQIKVEGNDQAPTAPPSKVYRSPST